MSDIYINRELANRLIKYNAFLSEWERTSLLDLGTFRKEHLSQILENTPELSPDEIRLIQKSAILSLYSDKRSKRKGASDDLMQKLIKKVKNALVTKKVHEESRDNDE